MAVPTFVMWPYFQKIINLGAPAECIFKTIVNYVTKFSLAKVPRKVLLGALENIYVEIVLDKCVIMDRYDRYPSGFEKFRF